MKRSYVSLLLFLVTAWLTQACSSSRSAAHAIIFNESNQETPIRLSITHTHQSKPHTIIQHTLKPGLQEVEVGRFAKGQYLITAETVNGKVSFTKSVSLDTERWIIINYISTDSLSIHKKYGYVDTTVLKKIEGRYTGVDIYSENRRPPSL